MEEGVKEFYLLYCGGSEEITLVGGLVVGDALTKILSVTGRLFGITWWRPDPPPRDLFPSNRGSLTRLFLLFLFTVCVLEKFSDGFLPPSFC